VSLHVALLALGAGLLVAILTAPVGVSGAVFLLPIQLDLLRVPSPAVTPTNLLFNVVATPGAAPQGYTRGEEITIWHGMRGRTRTSSRPTTDPHCEFAATLA